MRRWQADPGSPTPGTAYIANNDDATVTVIATGVGYDPANPVVETSGCSVSCGFAVYGNPEAVAVSPDGTHIYLGDSLLQQELFPEDATTWNHTVTALPIKSEGLNSVAISPDGSDLYVTENSDVEVLNPAPPNGEPR